MSHPPKDDGNDHEIHKNTAGADDYERPIAVL